MKELKDLVIGDEVVVYDKYDNRRIAIVERITKTLVVVNNIKYRKSTDLHLENLISSLLELKSLKMRNR